MTAQTVYDLGVAWYATRLEPDWERATAEQATATFERHGLVSPFWSLATPAAPSAEDPD